MNDKLKHPLVKRYDLPVDPIENRHFEAAGELGIHITASSFGGNGSMSALDNHGLDALAANDLVNPGIEPLFAGARTRKLVEIGEKTLMDRENFDMDK